MKMALLLTIRVFLLLWAIGAFTGKPERGARPTSGRYPYTIDQAMDLCRSVARDVSQRDPFGTAGQLYQRNYDDCLTKQLREMTQR